MKFNIKTKPKLVYLEKVLSPSEFANFMVMLEQKYPKVAKAYKENQKQPNVNKWFEAFEKEARAIIKTCEEQPIQGENARIHLQSRSEAFKEILGETEQNKKKEKQ